MVELPRVGGNSTITKIPPKKFWTILENFEFFFKFSHFGWGGGGGLTQPQLKNERCLNGLKIILVKFCNQK